MCELQKNARKEPCRAGCEVENSLGGKIDGILKKISADILDTEK